MNADGESDIGAICARSKVEGGADAGEDVVEVKSLMSGNGRKEICGKESSTLLSALSVVAVGLGIEKLKVLPLANLPAIGNGTANSAFFTTEFGNAGTGPLATT